MTKIHDLGGRDGEAFMIDRVSGVGDMNGAGGTGTAVVDVDDSSCRHRRESLLCRRRRRAGRRSVLLSIFSISIYNFKIQMYLFQFQILNPKCY